jgi:hypothetical protein
MIDSQNAASFIPSSPTKARVALASDRGLPPGLSVRPGMNPLPVTPPVLRPFF